MKPAHIKDLPQGFGRALAHSRTNQLVTVESLARYGQISEQDIALIERGEREPSLSQFLRLAIPMEIPPGHLFNRAVAEWPEDPEYAPLPIRGSRPRLFRLAWIAKRRTVHESPEA
jgi:transcriptional regulator with XRE-family HTH domain